MHNLHSLSTIVSHDEVLGRACDSIVVLKEPERPVRHHHVLHECRLRKVGALQSALLSNRQREQDVCCPAM